MEKRYLTNWSYNAARIFDNLEKIVHAAGGVLVSEWDTRPRKMYLIENRTLSGAIREKEEFCERRETLNRATAATRAEIEKLKQIDNTPRATYYGDWQYIGFLLNDVYYYYQMDRNPFFDFHYTKVYAPGGVADRNHFLDNDKKEWLFDCFFSWNCSDADCMEAAQTIFTMLQKAPFSRMAGKQARKITLKPMAGENL